VRRCRIQGHRCLLANVSGPYLKPMFVMWIAQNLSLPCVQRSGFLHWRENGDVRARASRSTMHGPQRSGCRASRRHGPVADERLKPL
jgi:hypothetical protein